MENNRDQELLTKKRNKITATSEGEALEADKMEQSPKTLMKLLEEEEYGKEVVEMWTIGDNERNEWLQRQEAFLDEYDEFISPIYSAPSDWAASLHLPIAFTVSKTFHARFFAAVFSQDPMFTLSSRTEANVEREATATDVLNYALKDWANDYAGIEEEIDRVIWNWVIRGVGILKMGWEKRYQKYKGVVTHTVPVSQTVRGPDGQAVPVIVNTEVKSEEDIVELDFDGPVIKKIAPEDLVLIGGNGDPDKADAVIESCYLTASELYTLADRKIFDLEAVKKTIESGKQYIGSASNEGIKQLQSENSGVYNTNSTVELERYQILEAYIKKDVYDTGINSDLVVWVHKNSNTILRATFLNRIDSQTRKRPYAKFDFHKRDNQTYGIGLIELTYSICKEIDAINNMKMDFGLLSSMPFGYYRATASISQQNIPIEPGVLIPLDNPQADVFFPNLGNRTAWGSNEIQFLYALIERLTGLSDLNYGVLGAQGAARTASGVSAIMSESNTNLDIFLRRLNRGMKKMLNYTFAMIQDKMPAGLEFRVTGSDGNAYFRRVKDRKEIAGKFDFSLEPNSAASNPSVRANTAQQIYNMTANPLDLQLGIITPLNRYEATKNLLISMGVRDYSKYIQKPQGMERQFTPEEVVNRRLAGINVQLNPMMDIEGIINYVDTIMNTDELLGQFNETGAVALAALMQEAQQMLSAMQEMAKQRAVATQMQSNAVQSQQQAAPAATPGAQPLQTGEGA